MAKITEPSDLLKEIRVTKHCEIVDNALIASRVGDPPAYDSAGMFPAGEYQDEQAQCTASKVFVESMPESPAFSPALTSAFNASDLTASTQEPQTQPLPAPGMRGLS